MKKEFDYTRIEVCRICQGTGTVKAQITSCKSQDLQPRAETFTDTRCPVCLGSGMVKKTLKGTVTIEPYDNRH